MKKTLLATTALLLFIATGASAGAMLTSGIPALKANDNPIILAKDGGDDHGDGSNSGSANSNSGKGSANSGSSHDDDDSDDDSGDDSSDDVSGCDSARDVAENKADCTSAN